MNLKKKILRATGEKEHVTHRTPARVAVVSPDTAEASGGGTVSEADRKESSAVSSGSDKILWE